MSSRVIICHHIAIHNEMCHWHMQEERVLVATENFDAANRRLDEARGFLPSVSMSSGSRGDGMYWIGSVSVLYGCARMLYGLQ